MNETTPVPPAASSKKGLPVIAWVGIGCGTLIVIAVVVISLLVGMCKRTVGDISEFKKNPEKAAAEMMVRMNPDLKMVSQDEAKGEMTIRTKDGQEMTMNYKDVSQGKFMIKDAKGNVTEIGHSDLSKVPAWVPRLPKLKSANGSFQSQENGKLTGLYVATSDEKLDGLEEFFKAEAAKLQLTNANSSSFSADGVENRTLSFEGGERKLTVIITGKPGEDAQVNVNYEEGK